MTLLKQGQLMMMIIRKQYAVAMKWRNQNWPVLNVGFGELCIGDWLVVNKPKRWRHVAWLANAEITYNLGREAQQRHEAESLTQDSIQISRMITIYG
jgi:hypothetical protein